MTLKIYAIRNLLTGKMYVGQTRKTLAVRASQHASVARREGNQASAIGAALLKYGLGAFDCSVVQVCESQEELDRAEQTWIERLGSMSPRGYNLQSGGRWYVTSEATKRKLSERVIMKEQREKISRALRLRHDGGCKNGHPWTLENTRIVISSRGNRLRRCRICNNARQARVRAEKGQVPLRSAVRISFYCKRGHELWGSNLRLKKRRDRTERICRKCVRIWNRATRTRKATDGS